MPLDEVWPNWFTWWMGDSIGVLFFVPLTLLAFPEARPRRIGLAARLAIPLIVVGVLVAVAHRATQDSRREHTSREMAAIENELQFQLNAQITNLHLVERLLTLAPYDRSAAVRGVCGADPGAWRADARVGAARAGPPSARRSRRRPAAIGRRRSASSSRPRRAR